MPRPKLRVPEAEMDVLAALRRSGPMTVNDLAVSLGGSRPMTHGSVSTLLARLEAKGLVARRKAEVGKAFLYFSTPRAEGALRGIAERLVSRLFGGDRMALVASLLEEKPLAPDEIERLEGLLAERTRYPSAAREERKKR